VPVRGDGPLPAADRGRRGGRHRGRGRVHRPGGDSLGLLKDASAGELAAAVRVVAAGDALLAPGVTRRLIAEFARLGAPRAATRKHLDGLTDRETEVLALVARGMSNAEIAAHLVVAEQTVKTHVSRVLMKLALRDRAQAVVFAYENGLVRPGE
jgi:DNA-binding NarL/FixJ family response regulator